MMKWLTKKEIDDAINQITKHESELAKFLYQKQPPILRSWLPKSSGAIWTLNGCIVLNDRYLKNGVDWQDAWVVSLIAHEACHLRQGWERAFSVFGELEAWHMGFRLYENLGGALLSSTIRELLDMPLAMDRGNLQNARRCMAEYAGPRYLVQFLPLFPARQEIKYRIGQLKVFLRQKTKI